jgi:hypothetical protein
MKPAETKPYVPSTKAKCGSRVSHTVLQESFRNEGIRILAEELLIMKNCPREKGTISREPEIHKELRKRSNHEFAKTRAPFGINIPLYTSSTVAL